MNIDSRHSFRHSSQSWNPEGGRGKTTRRWKKPARHPIFVLSCGPLRSMVIPRPVPRYGAGIQGGWTEARALENYPNQLTRFSYLGVPAAAGLGDSL